MSPSIWGYALPGGDGRFWITGDYLLGYVKAGAVPPLVTTSPSDTVRTSAGVLGLSTTSILFDGTVTDDMRSGFRLGTGYWFDHERTLGIDAGFSVLESQSTIFGAPSDGTTILARPFYNAVTNAQDSVLIAFPGSSSGSVEVRATLGNLWDLHFDFTENVIDQHWFRLDSLVGYRYCRYDEGVHIGQNIVIVNPPPGSSYAEGTQIATVDNFGTQNAFNGCDLGLRTHLCWNRLSLDLLTKVAVGDLHRQVNINGSQVTTVPGAPAPSSQAGGVLALSTNSGNYSSNEFTYVPEIGANLSWM